jgi:hypothetical protein
MENVNWTDRVRNGGFERVHEEGNLLHTLERRLTGLVTSCVGTAF